MDKLIGGMVQIAVFVAVIMLIVAGVGAEEEIKSMYYKLSAGICAIIYYQLRILEELER